jgi:hypothetical protein
VERPVAVCEEDTDHIVAVPNTVVVHVAARIVAVVRDRNVDNAHDAIAVSVGTIAVVRKHAAGQHERRRG